MFDNVSKFIADQFSEDFASWLIGASITLIELNPSKLSLEPIRADALSLLQSSKVNVTPIKLLKMGIVVADNATSANSAIVNSWNLTVLGATQRTPLQLCIKMYLSGMGVRGIERVTDIRHTTVMHWIRAAGHQLRDAPDSEEIPEVTGAR